jgi:hypothetical protein
MLVYYYPPPIRGIGTAVPGSASDYLRRQWIAGAWRRSSLFEKLVFGLSIIAWWPSTVLHAAYLAAVLGPSRQAVSGKSPFRQFLEQLSVAALWMVPPKWYYIFEFYHDERRAHAGEYLQRVQTKPYIFDWLVDKVARKDPRWPFANKAYFSMLCERFDLPACKVIALADNARSFMFFPPHATEFPPVDLFIKVKSGRGGFGAEKWTYRDGRYHSASGRMLTEAGLKAYVLRKAWFAKRVVQPCVTNHSDLADINLGVLATVRVVTIRAEAGEVEATHAIFRMPQLRTACVDNLHAGGLGVAVDLETGRLRCATDLGCKVDSRWHDVHPATGARIEGRVLPYWQDVLDLARRAHRLIGDRVVVGWDIAILQDGPCLVEGNGKPDVDMLQRHYGQGLGETRFGKLLALHLAGRLAGNPLNGRPPAEVLPRRDLDGAALTGSGTPQ